jgi:hypothetical protein
MNDVLTINGLFSGEDALNPDDSAAFNKKAQQLVDEGYITIEKWHDGAEWYITKLKQPPVTPRQRGVPFKYTPPQEEE